MEKIGGGFPLLNERLAIVLLNWKVIHLVFFALNVTLNSVANSSHIFSIDRMARAVGAIRTASSA